ncbi:unnamed protein product [Bursaphelenchus xylophilus]|uniref:(pine wood nematode) hypothetical protein n=1 Tax=Bursaphelenchus xylophilus TaxID=6326 RepID=A0A1I7SPW1_BURXY|nr:unnamed protein product [Bursaphelenchus xylophilus]CAG9109286.1 unnamed protein product [Bursaphelenchus xylophilus]
MITVSGSLPPTAFMDNYGKRVFLQALIDRKAQLFGPTAAPGAEKDRLWREVFEDCMNKKCVGLRDVDHLRKTTWQNLQRRAKDKYERSRRGDGNAHLNEIDNMVINIIGTNFVNSSPDHSFNFGLTDDIDIKPSMSSENIDPDSDGCLLPTSRKRSYRATPDSNAFVNFNNMLDFDTSNILLQALQQQQQQVERERQNRDDTCEPTESDEEDQLKLRKLRAEVRKLEAEADKIRAEADSENQRNRLLQLDIELKELQVLKIKKELGIVKNGRIDQ